MRHSAVFAGVHIPVHAGEAKFFNSLLKLVVVLLSLAAPYNLADFREKHIHCAHCLAVVVEFHIESLYLFGIVGENHRLLEMFLHEETLMF